MAFGRGVTHTHWWPERVFWWAPRRDLKIGVFLIKFRFHGLLKDTEYLAIETPHSFKLIILPTSLTLGI